MCDGEGIVQDAGFNCTSSGHLYIIYYNTHGREPLADGEEIAEYINTENYVW